MGAHNIDRAKLRTAIRQLKNENIYYLLDEALDMLPEKKLAKLVGRYLDLRTLQPDSKEKASLLANIQAFEKASLRGDYYESFAVNSKNCTEMSKGTRSWIAECRRLLDRCVAESGKNAPDETLKAIDTIVGLLRHIDKGLDDVIFFADEGGSWQVGVDWNKLLPVWFKSLSSMSEPAVYVSRVTAIINEFCAYDRDKHLAIARRVATPAQKRAFSNPKGR
ncbi:MAG: hypothetical protein ABIJ53_09730 [Verrucomicrobiota bacterium]